MWDAKWRDSKDGAFLHSATADAGARTAGVKRRTSDLKAKGLKAKRPESDG